MGQEAYDHKIIELIKKQPDLEKVPILRDCDADDSYEDEEDEEDINVNLCLLCFILMYYSNVNLAILLLQ